MKKIEIIIIFLFIFWTAMPALAELPPLPPGEGDQISIFRARHMNMEENQEIMDFINTYGIGDFQETGNRTHTYVYIIPKGNCSNKLVFLERGGDIIWVRQIGMNETIPFKPWDPLDDFFSAYPAARGNETIRSFIEASSPKKWDDSQINQSSSLVYLISEVGPFRELMFLVKNGSIVQIQTFDESKVSVNRTKALEIAAAEINSSRTPADVRVVFRGSEAFWALSYMEGPTVTTVFVDTENGVLYYCLSAVEEKSESSFPEVSEFKAGFVLTVILGISFFLGSAGRFKK